MLDDVRRAAVPDSAPGQLEAWQRQLSAASKVRADRAGVAIGWAADAFGPVVTDQQYGKPDGADWSTLQGDLRAAGNACG